MYNNYIHVVNVTCILTHDLLATSMDFQLRCWTEFLQLENNNYEFFFIN